MYEVVFDFLHAFYQSVVVHYRNGSRNLERECQRNVPLRVRISDFHMYQLLPVLCQAYIHCFPVRVLEGGLHFRVSVFQGHIEPGSSKILRVDEDCPGKAVLRDAAYFP